MHKKADPWYVRLLRTAYVDNRGWIEWFYSRLANQKPIEFSNTTKQLRKKCRLIQDALSELEAKNLSQSKKTRRLALSLRLNQARMAKSAKQDQAEHEAMIKRTRRKRAIAAKQALQNGALNFKNILKLVLALAIYFPFVRGGSRVRRLLHPLSAT